MTPKKTLLREHSSRYGILFDLFRRSSNETDTIGNKLTQEIEQIKNNSKALLDIGASDGLLAQKLYPHFEKIVGIERNKDDIYALDSLGIDSYCCLWEDFDSPEKFDIVLASHMLYYIDDENYVKECKRMQEYLKPEGKGFLIVNAHQNDYANLMDTFYPIFHEGKEPFPKTNGLEKKLNQGGIDCKSEILTFSVNFMNPIHFLSLCGFFLGYDPQECHILDNSLTQYYEDSLKPHGNYRAKSMDVDIEMITFSSLVQGGK
ncbi:methyltransferase domain-containing protein [Candidatus Woesearchaeota archaeon]|nr:methyltransferase domain-containing protein [Candidatus Woesearchaeota archaeon]